MILSKQILYVYLKFKSHFIKMKSDYHQLVAISTVKTIHVSSCVEISFTNRGLNSAASVVNDELIESEITN